MILLVLLIGIFLGMPIGNIIGGHVAYREGVEDERRKWYIHAHYHLHDESEFKKGDEK